MKKILGYLAVGFAFFSGGIIFAVKYLNEKVVVNVKKQRIRGDNNKMIVDVDPTVETLKSARKQAKIDKKQDKIIKRNRKKADKINKRLEKNS